MAQGGQKAIRFRVVVGSLQQAARDRAHVVHIELFLSRRKRRSMLIIWINELQGKSFRAIGYFQPGSPLHELTGELTPTFNQSGNRVSAGRLMVGKVLQ